MQGTQFEREEPDKTLSPFKHDLKTELLPEIIIFVS